MQALSQLSYSPPFLKTGREDSGKSGQTINPRDPQFKGNLGCVMRCLSSLWEQGFFRAYARSRFLGRR